MRNEEPLKEFVSVTEMARLCRLSRARFYQLTREGIFPTPSRNEETGRPFFDREQQERCLLVRRSNKGANGKAVMFYGCRPEAPQKPKPKRKQLPISRSPKGQTRQDPVLTELRHGLTQLGMTNLTDNNVREALRKAYPDGHRDVESAELLRAVFRELQRRNTADNLRG
jgi:hypothetical protein